jgi:hypothetical protein
MPDRIIRAGILTSEAVNSLSPEGEVFYRRLISVADDYGRFDGRTVVLRASLYPLQLDHVRNADLDRLIAECVKASLVRLYTCQLGKPYLEIVKFGQRIQSKSKWPEPADYQPIPESTVVNGESPPIRSRVRSRMRESNADADGALPPTLDYPDFHSVWEEWLAHLRAKRKPITPQAKKQQLRQLEKWGLAGAIEAINKSIRNNWQGLFEPERANSSGDAI